MKNYITKKMLEYMDNYGLNTTTLAILSTLSEKTIKRIISQQKTPTNRMMQKICMVFCISVSQFFDDYILENYAYNNHNTLDTLVSIKNVKQKPKKNVV